MAEIDVQVITSDIYGPHSLATDTLVWLYITILGYGQEYGGVQSEIYNRHKAASIKIIYLQVFPWHFRLFLHTLRIRVDHVDMKPGM